MVPTASIAHPTARPPKPSLVSCERDAATAPPAPIEAPRTLKATVVDEVLGLVTSSAQIMLSASANEPHMSSVARRRPRNCTSPRTPVRSITCIIGQRVRQVKCERQQRADRIYPDSGRWKCANGGPSPQGKDRYPDDVGEPAPSRPFQWVIVNETSERAGDGQCKRGRAEGGANRDGGNEEHEGQHEGESTGDVPGRDRLPRLRDGVQRGITVFVESAYRKLAAEEQGEQAHPVFRPQRTVSRHDGDADTRNRNQQRRMESPGVLWLRPRSV